MATSVFVNLPVADLERTKAFYSALGAEIVPEFTDDNATCIKWDENVFFMMLKTDYFGTFTDKPVVTADKGAGVITALSRDSKEEVARTRELVLANGGGENKPTQDYGFMVQSSMTDPDGHILEFMWMDPAAIESGPPDMAPAAHVTEHPEANDRYADAEEEGWPARE
ncbi:VOC family protein [Microbacterium sp. G2-8]|uniref:VOC family protein n=1 Tax=Microbacterium sp. G2-8 TaxID=2842454 RepID=UPI0021A9AD07|nr:VOC family protein [Microbacterium sp. G2-8]